MNLVEANSIDNKSVIANDETFHIVLNIEGLTKRFGELIAVRSLAFDVREGEVFGLLGPNGAGKSTTINMMCGLVSADAGNITLYGEPVKPGGSFLRKNVGVCPQEIILYQKLTCIEQLVFIGTMYDVPRRQAQQRAEQLLIAMGLIEKRKTLASALSGGMQRRLNLIMAIMHDPKVVILDEPEAGLDPQSRVLVREYIQNLARKKTVIVTTHNMDEADRICDRVAIIDYGSLLTLDTPENLKRTVGKTSVLEIHLREGSGTQPLIDDLHRRGIEVVQVNQTLVVRHSNVVSTIPTVMDCLKAYRTPVAEIQLRENTLEDVFITLTGRRLRE
jgi:ABC-2 type transport system ATP-binding protein